MRWRKWVGVVVATLVCVTLQGAPRADTPRPDTPPIFGADIMGRNGDWVVGRLALGYPIAAVGSRPMYPIRFGPFARVEVGVGGVSGGVGFASFVASMDMPVFVIWALSFEGKVMRTWLSNWPTATYAGGELCAAVAWFKFSVAALADVSQARSGTYYRAGVGLGFGL
jgi:hypothetical protein